MLGGQSAEICWSTVQPVYPPVDVAATTAVGPPLVTVLVLVVVVVADL